MTRDEVQQVSLHEKFEEDKSAQRLQREEIVLKKFGLLDHDFHLGPFLLSLLTEQVGGYYEPKTKTVYLLDWLAPEQQKPVLAHELTHALQDQHVDLQKWSEMTHYDVAKNATEDNVHIQTDEADTAREAVLEGQAMVVFMDYGCGRCAQNAGGLDPEMMDRMKDAMADTSDSPVMARAPLVLQQSLIFPYDEGLGFEDAVLVKQGKDAAFGGVLASPPSSTAEILHPATYMTHAPVPVLRLPDIHPLIGAEWAPYDVGVMGELDVEILAELFGGTQIATALTPEWNGGIYYAAQRKSAVSDEAKKSTASIGLLYYSRWKNENSALSFLRVYGGELPRKYSGLARRSKDEERRTTSRSTPRRRVMCCWRFPARASLSARDFRWSWRASCATRSRACSRMRRCRWRGRSSTRRGAAGRNADEDGGGLFDPGLARIMASAGVMRAAIDAQNTAARSASGRYTLVQQ